MSKVPGVMSNDVDLSTGRGRFQYDSNSIGPRDIIKHLNVSIRCYDQIFLECLFRI